MSKPLISAFIARSPQKVLSAAGEAMKARIHNIPPESFASLTMPELRSIGATAVAGGEREWRAVLSEPFPATFAERVVRGVVINKAPLTHDERHQLRDEYIRSIDSWGLCDTFVTSLRLTSASDKALMWERLGEYASSGEEFQIRFAFVCMNSYYNKGEYAARALRAIDGIKHPEYYVKMAQAWLLATLLVTEPAAATAFMTPGNNTLEDWTYNKAVQKATESFRVSDSLKQTLRGWKRSPVVTGWVQMPDRTVDRSAPSPRKSSRHSDEDVAKARAAEALCPGLGEMEMRAIFAPIEVVEEKKGRKKRAGAAKKVMEDDVSE